MIRPLLLTATLALCLAPQVVAQSLSRADSALVMRILLAEDRRDSVDAAINEGLGHADPRVRTMAQRARGRITDAKFVTRSALPPLSAPPVYADPAWRLRLRALNAQSPCTALRVAVTDSAWPVRLLAADIAGGARRACTADAELAAVLKGWVDSAPVNASARPRGRAS